MSVKACVMEAAPPRGLRNIQLLPQDPAFSSGSVVRGDGGGPRMCCCSLQTPAEPRSSTCSQEPNDPACGCCLSRPVHAAARPPSSPHSAGPCGRPPLGRPRHRRAGCGSGHEAGSGLC